MSAVEVCGIKVKNEPPITIRYGYGEGSIQLNVGDVILTLRSIVYNGMKKNAPLQWAIARLIITMAKITRKIYE